MDVSVNDIINNLNYLCEASCINKLASNTLFFTVFNRDYENDNFKIRDRKNKRTILSSKLKNAKDILTFLEEQFKEGNRICFADFQLYALNRYVNIVKVEIYDTYSMRGENHDIHFSVRVPPKHETNKGKFDLNFSHSKFFMFRLWLLSLKLKWTGVID